MAKKRHAAEQIISKLREAEVLLAKGMKMPQVCRKLGITEQTYYRRLSCIGFTLLPE
jgi:putative transposase